MKNAFCYSGFSKLHKVSLFFAGGEVWLLIATIPSVAAKTSRRDAGPFVHTVKHDYFATHKPDILAEHIIFFIVQFRKKFKISYVFMFNQTYLLDQYLSPHSQAPRPGPVVGGYREGLCHAIL